MEISILHVTFRETGEGSKNSNREEVHAASPFSTVSAHSYVMSGIRQCCMVNFPCRLKIYYSLLIHSSHLLWAFSDGHKGKQKRTKDERMTTMDKYLVSISGCC